MYRHAFWSSSESASPSLDEEILSERKRTHVHAPSRKSQYRPLRDRNLAICVCLTTATDALRRPSFGSFMTHVMFFFFEGFVTNRFQFSRQSPIFTTHPSLRMFHDRKERFRTLVFPEHLPDAKSMSFLRFLPVGRASPRTLTMSLQLCAWVREPDRKVFCS